MNTCGENISRLMPNFRDDDHISPMFLPCDKSSSVVCKRGKYLFVFTDGTCWIWQMPQLQCVVCTRRKLKSGDISTWEALLGGRCVGGGVRQRPNHVSMIINQARHNSQGRCDVRTSIIIDSPSQGCWRRKRIHGSHTCNSACNQE